MSEQRLSGACACGRVRYAVRDSFEYALNCHCSGCRAATGSAFKSFAGIGAEALAQTAGTEDTLIVGDRAGDHDVRCGTCGSLLWSLVRDGRYVHVALGTLRDTPTIRPQAHIFVGSKAPWHEITDDLPQHDELPAD